MGMQLFLCYAKDLHQSKLFSVFVSHDSFVTFLIVFYPFNLVISINEPVFSPVDEVNSCKSRSRLDINISTKSAVIVVLNFLGVQSMQDVTVVRHVHPYRRN